MYEELFESLRKDGDEYIGVLKPQYAVDGLRVLIGDADNWKTINGAHVLLGKGGRILGGAGGVFTGKVFGKNFKKQKRVLKAGQGTVGRRKEQKPKQEPPPKKKWSVREKEFEFTPAGTKNGVLVPISDAEKRKHKWYLSRTGKDIYVDGELATGMLANWKIDNSKHYSLMSTKNRIDLTTPDNKKLRAGFKERNFHTSLLSDKTAEDYNSNVGKYADYILNTGKPILYTHGLSYRNPVIHNKPISKQRALEIMSKPELITINSNENAVYLNTYSGMDMW